MENLLWERDAAEYEIYRMKGIVLVSSSERPHLVQAVRELYDITEAPSGARPSAALKESRIVVIGRNLVTSTLQAGFLQCHANL